jgi:hypothetical protein
MRTKNITESNRKKLDYQLLKLEYLAKRKAGLYVFFDTKNNRLIASGEQTKNSLKDKPRQADPEEVVVFLKSLNNYLEKTEKLNARRSILALFN